MGFPNNVIPHSFGNGNPVQVEVAFEGFTICWVVVPLKCIEDGVGYIILRSPYTAYSIYLRGTVHVFIECGTV